MKRDRGKVGFRPEGAQLGQPRAQPWERGREPIPIAPKGRAIRVSTSPRQYTACLRSDRSRIARPFGAPKGLGRCVVPGLRPWALVARPFGANAQPGAHTVAAGRSPRRRGARRAGYVYVMFAFMFFGLLGLAALVIDIGFARLAQRQMQSAVDSAALEGLRWQSVSSANPLLPRQQASQIVADLFTDYCGLQRRHGPVRRRARGEFQRRHRPRRLAAGQTMSPGAPPVYQPMASSGTAGLELNPVQRD